MNLEDVSICFEKQIIIDSVNLDINKGEIFVLMGPSGSGKTTLLKGIAGLLPISSGILKWKNDKGKTGLVFQDPRLFPHMTVVENLAFGLRAKGIAKKERNHRVKEFLQILQLEGLEKRFPHQLSGGQQQRVSLGRVLVLKPDLLLLDEPFASLDTPLRIQLTEWLYQLQRKQGFSILWVTHYLDEAFSVADRVGVIMNGKLRQVGKPQDFYQKPWSENVASFFALKNRFSFSQWNKWFPNGFQHLETDKMGWIPANALSLSTDSQLSILEDFPVMWLDGVVTRVKNETNGHIALVKSEGQNLEVKLTVWEALPAVNSPVKVGVPLNKIIWYPKEDH
jgi:ABC-type sugar transport system ATPase subunit